MLKSDLIRLKHILESAGTAQDFIAGMHRADLDGDLRTAFAVVRCIEIIGEAANGISKDFQDAHPMIPWRPIIAMRNRLIHAYFDVDLDHVWSVVTVELPPLVARIQEVIQNEGNAEQS